MSVRESGPTYGRRTDRNDTVAEYWSWFAVALFLLVTVDLLTTMFAASVVGIEFEANPIVRWALGQGLGTVVALNVTAVVVATLMFSSLMGRLDDVSDRYRPSVEFTVEAWLGGLIALGLSLFANNLSVIVFGVSLL